LFYAAGAMPHHHQAALRPIRLISTGTAVSVTLSCRYDRGRGGFGGQEEVRSVEPIPALRPTHAHSNKGCIVGQKRPILPKHVWSIRVRLKMANNKRDLALFNMAIDSKRLGCDLACLKVNYVYAASCVKERATVTQGKTRKPVRFE
jgi:hypothetical protein